MATKALEKELLDLEKQYWQALKDKNYDEALRLTDDECIVTGAQGVGKIAKKDFMAMMQQANYTLDAFELDDVKVRVLGDDAAIVAYKVHEELTVEGKPMTLDAADASTWVRKRGRWVVALHTESIEGDAFGRDRTSS